MGDKGRFTGFSDDTLKFYRGLAVNNKKVWFDDHRGDFEDHVMAPARDFVVDMGERLELIAPNIIADPRVNKSLFRISKDVRFSKDKSPYKTHLAILFWEGRRKRMECSGFYFHVEPELLLIGAGIYMFPKEHLDEYRRSVVHPTHGPKLAEAISEVEGGSSVKGDGRCGLYGGERYKKVPRGYDPDHERAGLLLNKGLTAFAESPIPREFYSEAMVDYAFEYFVKMAPLHRWLVEMVERVGE
ncbi:MAG: DUF2461 domain-containing protein [Deltaproteobacteria bacterium]|uniref:DUF2461 domain-containing protein n=1 Tax=Candidatus Zymogenus saltonus TaxID=2844893 RepID=A0A9D8KJ77_9DELT|nr:DUF2461 domain-containing protein [Candidatus Zymogenus saltonus]